MWLTFSFICLTLGGVTLLVTVSLFIKWDALNIIQIITGSKARRGIQWYKDREDTNGESDSNDGDGEEEIGNHHATESLLAKTFNRTKDLALSRGLTRSRNIKSEEIVPNKKVKPKTKGFNYTNGISQETSILSDNGAVPIGQHTEILSEVELKHYGLDEKESNFNKESLSIELFGDEDEISYDDFEDNLDSSKTTMLVEETKIRENEVEEEINYNSIPEVTKVSTFSEDKEQVSIEYKKEASIKEMKEEEGLERDSAKTDILTESEGVFSSATSTEIPFVDGATSVLMTEDNTPVGTSLLDSWDTITVTKQEEVVEEKKSALVSDQIVPTKIEIEGDFGEIVTDFEEREHKEEKYSAKTQIITDEDKPNFKKVLKEDFESIEFHEYTVIRVESSYGVVDYK